MKVTAETITAGQIRSLRTDASDHAVTTACRRALTVAELRKACEQACRDVAEADPTGMMIEHRNHALLEKGLELGRALIAREQCAAAWNARHADECSTCGAIHTDVDCFGKAVRP